ncbi:hypothetical protein AAMO2058_000859600 [Amorphochlora amoebiformis]
MDPLTRKQDIQRVLNNMTRNRNIGRMSPMDVRNLHAMNALYLRDMMLARMQQRRRFQHIPQGLRMPLRPLHPKMIQGPRLPIRSSRL